MLLDSLVVWLVLCLTLFDSVFFLFRCCRRYLSSFTIYIIFLDNKEEAELKFQDISEANEVLSDLELKAKYDRGEPVFENQGGGGGGGGGGGQQQFYHRQGGGARHHFHFNSF